MQLKQDNNEVVGPREGLSALADEWRIGRGSWSLLPAEEADDAGHTAVRAWAKQMPASARTALLSALRTIGEPAQIGLLHYGVGDDGGVAKASLGWSAAADTPVVVLSDAEEGCVLRWRDAHWLSAHIAEVLAIDSGTLTAPTQGVPLSPVALLVLVAITEVYREGRLLSQLAHSEGLDAFAEEDVMAFLRDDALADDHRRPLCFLNGLLPTSIGTLELWNEREEALRELDTRGLIERAPRSDDEGERWRLTTAGREVERGLWHSIAKVGVRVSRPQSDGGLGHAVFVLIRSFHGLWLLNLSGREAMVTSLDRDAVGTFLEEALAVRLVSQTSVEPVASEPAVREVPCPSCGAFLPEDKKFCGDCGAAMGPATSPSPQSRPREPRRETPARPERMDLRTCQTCGAALSTGARFCRQCGTPI